MASRYIKRTSTPAPRTISSRSYVQVTATLCLLQTQVRFANVCIVPAVDFAAQGEQDIPDSYASQIPSIAFTVPDLDGQATLQLKALDSGQSLACITSAVDNGKSLSVPAVSYVAAGIAGAALLLSGISALGVGAHAGSATPSP